MGAGRMLIVDVLLAAVAIIGPLYFYFNFQAMVMRAGVETPLDLAMGLLTIVAVLWEAILTLAGLR
jgi:TRAP-type uncharacterized transport system fused permease subunit